MMSDLTVILLTIGITLLSVGLVVMWQERRYAEDESSLRTDD